MSPEPHPLDPSSSRASPGTGPLACVACRSRKLRCDRATPSCARCLKVGGECVYPDSRRRPAFKRRNVQELEARLAQVESYLKQVNNSANHHSANAASSSHPASLSQGDFALRGQDALDMSSQDPAGGAFAFSHPSQPQDKDPFTGNGHGNGYDNGNNGALLGLGYSETLPPFHVQEELHNIFFQKEYHLVPVVHSGRYYQSLYAGPLRKPPMSLQYAMWALAASGHAKYDRFAHVFYTRARHYIEADEMKDLGEHFITVAHAQALCICGSYEAKCMLFTRAATTCAKAVRLCQMMGLDRLDGGCHHLPPSLAPHSTWEELEERRRVFWGIFAMDSFSSISTGWPTLINPDDITTRLPASEEAFASGQEEPAPFMDDVFTGSSYSAFASTLLISQIFRSIIKHMHSCKPDDLPEDVTRGPYWRRHRDLDNKLSTVFMFLPAKFRFPRSLRDPGAIHLNLNLHAAVIILHHAALDKAELHDLADDVVDFSLGRLKASAEEIVHILKMSTSTYIFKSPLCALALYCCTTVYVYLGKRNPVSGLTATDKSNLEVVMQAMEAFARKFQITCGFIQQACIDIERNNLTSLLKFPWLEKYLAGASGSHIPLITRSSVSKHTDIIPVLPGRLPLNNPEGKILGTLLDADKDDPPRPFEEPINNDCFQPVLGAATRAGPVSPTVGGMSRGRTATSPGVSPDAGMPPNAMPGGKAGQGLACAAHQATAMLNGNGTSGLGICDRLADASCVLPDRNHPSTVPQPGAYRLDDEGPGAAFPAGSHSTTPAGLGNTREENRIDLRDLQERMAAHLWPAAQAQPMHDAIFTSSVAETLFNMAGLQGNIEKTAVSSWDSTLDEPMAWRSDMP
ncbi:uncharacterized protein UV8b_06463 [Ustilaginoidea virens]|uniref:Zn(2)-C6 fungal-type domain-containing protein n=1 Tax=Ustilaginoidea virens TaxID=1159556 RepID=A0A063CBU8_USTVR|nr:uncharacterized protein UV8b_06463 [Ustilaginoidea virens]QUC22222.1 hypothetical protein UV8b_06463 [Ustilaginoidea virens]GAO14064.1 hypothetical protein UVI_02038430 [Ustilaginoidea virens]